jgi:hypothetical protein
VTPLGPGEIRARKRPGVILALAAVRLGVGFCLAFPVASLIAASGIGERVEGDRALFEAGGYLLLELLRTQSVGLSAAIRGIFPLFLVGLTLTVASNAALLVALNMRERLKLRTWLASTVERVPPLLALSAGTALAQGAVLLVGGVAADALPSSATAPVRSSIAQLAVWALAALVAGALGGFADVVKAALVRHQATLGDALSQALACAVRAPLRTGFGWLPYAALFLLAVAAASQVTTFCDVSRSGAWRVAVVFGVHQLVVVSSVALRAGWYARALRIAAVG